LKREAAPESRVAVWSLCGVEVLRELGEDIFEV